MYKKKDITPFKRQVWIRRSNVIYYSTNVFSTTSIEPRCYFDNGCSRHTPGNSINLKFVKPSKGTIRLGMILKEKSLDKGS